MSQSSDRVNQWGEFLAELSQTRQQQAIDKKNKYLECYKQLETLAINFNPEQLKRELSSSFPTNKFVYQTVLFHTIDLVKKDDFKNFILQAFKSKQFLIRPFILLFIAFKDFLDKMPGEIYAIFIPALVSGFGFSLSGLIFPEEVGISRIEIIKWSLLLILMLIIIFCFALLSSYLVELITKPNKFSFFIWLENKLYFSEIILIIDRRQIKLTELRLLFSELEKLKLEPELLITRKYDLTVDFKLQVRGNHKFIDLLK